MAQEHETVVTSVAVALPIEVVNGYRLRSSNLLSEHTDTEIVKALAEDILNRYFNEEYFDIDSIMA